MILGNLEITSGNGVVTLKLNTYREGRPLAVFTPREIEKLVQVLQGHLPKMKLIEPSEDDEFANLI